MPLLQTFGNDTVRGYERFGPLGSPAAYELISTTVLGATAASVTFSGLGTSASAYKHLQIRFVARGTTGAGTLEFLRGQFNSDSGNNYGSHYVWGQGSAAQSGVGASNLLSLGIQGSNGASSGVFGAGVVDVLDFASTSKNKVTRGLSGGSISGGIVGLFSSAWYSTAAITSVTLLPDSSSAFAIGSRFSLYGLR